MSRTFRVEATFAKRARTSPSTSKVVAIIALPASLTKLAFAGSLPRTKVR